MGEVALLLVCVAGSILLLILCLVAWQIYIKLHHEHIYNIVYRLSLAALGHFGAGATDAIRSEWVVVEARKVLPSQDSQIILLFAKSSLASIHPMGSGDDNEELEELLSS